MSAESKSVTDSESSSPLVWYASFGSNMNVKRFSCYITGGIPDGGTRDYLGCTDKSLPLGDMAVHLPQPLYFAGDSKVWTGGLAFIGHNTGDKPTLGRAYLISDEQFKEVVAQESWRTEALPIDLAELAEKGRLTLGDGSGNYDELIYCGEQDGYPIVSFTSPTERRPFTAPAKNYLRMISSGVMEAHGLSIEETASYLGDKPGVLGAYTVEHLVEIIK